MTKHQISYRPGTRAARFLQLRDAILARSHHMRRTTFGSELRLGPFLIHYAPPGALGPLRPYNLSIWPGGKLIAPGHFLYDNKVANVDWTQWDEVDILSYRTGAWEAELLALLSEWNETLLPCAAAR